MTRYNLDLEEYKMFENEKIYIAGPECFYENGYAALAAMKSKAEALGFGVTLPNDHPLDMENPDLQKRASSIFDDLKTIMKETTVIIADLEAYRGSEPDSGTVYEIGMAYADGLRCYGYTRDKRNLACKDQKYVLEGTTVYDEHGKEAPYKDLPFAPTVVGSTKIIEGDFDDCLHMLMNDIEEEWKEKGRTASAHSCKSTANVSGEKFEKHEKPVVYLADLVRYSKDAAVRYEKMKEIAAGYGLELLTPLDQLEKTAKEENGNAYTMAARLTENYAGLVKSCDAVLADLNDYRGYECANDVGFECGMAFEWGKKLYGFMDDTRPAIEKIPHLGEQNGFRDMTGSNVENFNYPINLMFSCSMEIFEGKFEEAIRKVASILASESI